MNFSFEEILYNKVIVEKVEKDFRDFDTNPSIETNRDCSIFKIMDGDLLVRYSVTYWK